MLAMDLASRTGVVIDNVLLFKRVQDEQLRLQPFGHRPGRHGGC